MTHSVAVHTVTTFFYFPQTDEILIQTIVNLLSAEEQAIGLTQPSGIGQRPRPLPLDAMNNSSYGGMKAMMAKYLPFYYLRKFYFVNFLIYPKQSKFLFHSIDCSCTKHRLTRLPSLQLGIRIQFP